MKTNFYAYTTLQLPVKIDSDFFYEVYYNNIWQFTTVFRFRSLKAMLVQNYDTHTQEATRVHAVMTQL